MVVENSESGTSQEIHSEQRKYSYCNRVSLFHVSSTAQIEQYVWLLSILYLDIIHSIKKQSKCRKARSAD